MTSIEPPQPDGVRTLDELIVSLNELRAWAGVSEREVHRRVVAERRARGMPEQPSFDTVHRCFRPGRARLNTELLTEVVRALRGDPARWRRAQARIAGDATEAAVVTVLDAPPADLPAFTGRRTELDGLVGRGDEAAPIAVIEGMAGIGKTTLAVHAAHRLARRRQFDVVLWVNLRGYAPDLAPADPAAVLDGFLRRLGMSPDRVRLLDLAGREREFQRRLTGRRVLVGLDNARSEEQVRPLLPAGPGCLTLVTSRHHLSGLSDARRLPLEAFAPDESLELLRRAGGDGRVDGDRETAGRIAGSVGHLPLALGVLASRIRHGRDWTLADHLERLNDHLSRLTVDDGVEAALRLSYEGLDAPLRRLFRLLALHPGPGVEAHAAAALAGEELQATRRGLRALLAASLLREPAPGRYEFHDLVGVYAAARAHDEEPAHARRAALSRLLDHHERAAALAMDHLAPYERHHRPPVAVATATATGPSEPLEFPDWEAATAWLNAERSCLLAAAVHAATHPGDHDRPEHCVRMSLLLFRHLDVSGHYGEAETLHAHAARAPEPEARGWALTYLGTTHWRLGRYPEAMTALAQARDALREAGDVVGQGRAAGCLGEVLQHLGRLPEAGECFGEAMSIIRALGDGAERPDLGPAAVQHGVIYEPLGRYPKSYSAAEEAVTMGKEVLAITRALGDKLGEGNVLGSIGSIHRQVGDGPEALAHLRQAREIQRGIGNRAAEIGVLNELGAALRELGEPPAEGAAGPAGPAGPVEALRHHEEAAALAHRLGDRYQQARACDGMARCHVLLGDPAAARARWEEAHRLFADLGTPEADDVTARLRDLDGAGPS